MEIFVNGTACQTSVEATLLQLLTELGVAQQRLAIELNSEIVPRSGYAVQQLHAGDRIELIKAVGGG